MKRSITGPAFAAVLQALPALLGAVPAAAAVQFSVGNLGTLGGGSSTASGISASGQVVGSSYTSGNIDSHAFVVQAGALRTGHARRHAQRCLCTTRPPGRRRGLARRQ